MLVLSLEKAVATGLDLFPITSQSISEREKEGSFKKRKANSSKDNLGCRTEKYHIMKTTVQGLEQKLSELNVLEGEIVGRQKEGKQRNNGKAS